MRVDERNIEFLREIITKNKIERVIVQGAFIHVKRFKLAAKGLKCKVFFAHHFRPGGELEFFHFGDVLRRRPTNFTDLLRWGRDIALFPRLRKEYVESLREYYREAYEEAESTVILTERYIPLYQQMGRFNERSKFRIIPNGLSFSEYLPVEKLGEKKPIVLIVSRLDETHKKLSKALRIWNFVKKNPISERWQLKIVGDGPDRTKYEGIVRKDQIPDVEFLGRQNPLPFYKEASILMMTSDSEAWGLTLTEAQQMGVVPVAFDTYESLHDIIEDGKTGRIIPANDQQGYADAMLELMANPTLRTKLASDGLESCRRFSQDRIGQMWWQLLNQ